MYHDRNPFVVEGNDITALRASKLEKTKDGRTLWHTTLELRPDKELLPPERASELRLHVTDGATHVQHVVDPLPVDEPEATEDAETLSAPLEERESTAGQGEPESAGVAEEEEPEEEEEIKPAILSSTSSRRKRT